MTMQGRPVGVKGEAKQEIACSRSRGRSSLNRPRERPNRRCTAPTNGSTRAGGGADGPGLRASDERVRGTSTYPPGAKENGGIFCHANTWSMVAAALLGWDDHAYQYYRQVLPLCAGTPTITWSNRTFTARTCAGRSIPLFGQGRNTWLTGTAAWTYVAGTQ